MAPHTFSTLRTAAPGQFAHWRELICQAFLDLTPETDLRDGFAGTVTQWAPTGSPHAPSIARIDSQRQQVRRTEADIARAGRGGYYANLQVRGASAMTQGGRTTVLRPGDLAVVDTTQPFAFDFPGDFRQLTLYLPAALLGTGVHTATRVDTSTGIGAAVRHAMQAIAGDRLAPAAAARLAAHTGGMLAVILDPASSMAHYRPRSARGHAAVLADIEEHLADDDLSPAATARRLGVSPRWIYGQFAGRERSYAGTVRRLRLERARRDLGDPALRHLRVIDIAADAGFGDVTTFYRAFRREFGHPPAQLRTADPRTTDPR